ncbi:MAG: hypothetical protein D0530_00480 [Methylococcales bacterium]|nr:MAG: hypothetical protein D0530_00480 [Methylococcales bacterium]
MGMHHGFCCVGTCWALMSWGLYLLVSLGLL